MVIYTCATCNKVFKLKGDYTRHLNKKIPCSPKTIESCKDSPKTIEQIPTEPIHKLNPLMCRYCNRIFSRKDVLNRHLVDRCKVKKSMDSAKEQLFQKLLTECEELKGIVKTQDERIKALEKEKSDTKQIIGHQTNTHIQTQNNILNIKLVAYGKEDLSSIPDQVYKQLIMKGFMSVPALVEKVHFDKNKPENQNIYISNIRDDYVLIYDGEEWKLSDKKETLDGLYDEKVYILENKFNELIKDLPEQAITKFKRFLDKAENDDTKDNIKKELKMMLYNYRKMVESTRKQIKQQ